MHVVLATDALAAVGGSETYLYTVAGNLVRLGHQVTVHALRQGLMSDQFRELGVDVVFEDGLPGELRRRARPGRRDGLLPRGALAGPTQVFVCHSALFDAQLPPMVPVPGSVVVTLSDRNGDRIRAMPGEYEIVRLRQPIDSVRLAPRGAPAARPRTALLLGNYLAGDALSTIVDAWSSAKVEVVQVGNLTQPTLDVAAAIADADIVVGKGRAVLDAMSCGRPAFLYDAFGSDGWVTAATYDALEADAFAGQSDPRVMGPCDLRAALDAYDPAMAHVNRELILKHHQDRKHAEALVGIFQRLAPGADLPVEASAELARLSRLRWRAEQENGHLRRQLDAVRVRLQETEAKLRLSEQRRRRRARAARVAEARLAALGEPVPGGEE